MDWLMDLFGFGGDSEEPQLPPPPEYYNDPYYTDMQSYLSTYGKNILEGNPNAYYGEMGAVGGPEFEKMLGLSNRDIQQSTAEAAARTGRGRGGYLPSVTAQTIADNTSKLRYQDYLKAMQGRQSLLSTGVGITEGVRQAGQQEGANRNTFNLKSYDYTRQNALFDINREDQNAAQEGDFLSNLFQIGVGGVTGYLTGGPVGALVGAAGGLGTLADSGALDKIFGINKSGSTDSLSSSTPGVSSLGKAYIGSSGIEDFIKSMKLNLN